MKENNRNKQEESVESVPLFTGDGAYDCCVSREEVYADVSISIYNSIKSKLNKLKKQK